MPNGHYFFLNLANISQFLSLIKVKINTMFCNRILVITVFACIALFCSSLALTAQVEDYDWASIPIGGGGYITGMQIHPSDPNIRYYRTDIGGAYKWDSAQARLRQIIFSNNDNHYGCGGIALNPNNPAEVFLALGRNCDGANNAIYKSYDYGETFEIVTNLPYYFATNGGRDCTQGTTDKDRQGSPIALNPQNTNELYIGTRDKGLYKMDLTTNISTRLASAVIPVNTETERHSIRSVVFHPVQQEYVVVGYVHYGIYLGNTNTQTYTIIGDVNTYPDLAEVSDISFSKDGDYMLVACKLDGIWKCTDPLGAATWSKVRSSTTIGEGYLTVECSPHDNGTAVTVVGGWQSLSAGLFEYSLDSANSWDFKDGSMGTNIYPWNSSNFGSRVAQIRFDPANPDRLFFTSWFTTMHTEDWTGNNIIWTNQLSAGHEEMVITDIACFPTNSQGNFIAYNGGDQIGWLDDDISQGTYPTEEVRDLIDNVGTAKKGGSVDFCESNPEHIVVCGMTEWDDSDAIIATSSDGGASFQRQTGYNESLGKAVVAMSCLDPQNMVIAQQDHIQYSLNGGSSFVDANAVTNLNPTCANTGSFNCLGASDLSGRNLNTSVFSAFRMVEADKVLSCVFYFYDWDDGSFHASLDGGQNWCKVNDIDLPDYGGNQWGQNSRLTATPGHARHLWINFNDGLYRSIDGGQNWSNIAGIDEAPAFALGKAAPGNTYPSLYLFGSKTADSNSYYYRSDDEGASWIQINNPAENELWKTPKVIEGDREVFGRVYSGLSGLGLYHGDSAVPNCAPSELLIKNTFDDLNSPSVPDWNFSTLGSAVANASINQWDNAVINITNPGTYDYDVQLRQDNFSITGGNFYTLRIRARADDPRDMSFKLRNRSNSNLTYLEKTIQLTTTFQDFAFVLQAPSTDTDMRLVLLFGGDDNDVYLDEISFEEHCNEVSGNALYCVDYLTLNGYNINSDLFHAKTGIISNGLIPLGQNVMFKAGQEFMFEPGFEVKLNAVFEGSIETCN